MTGTTPPPVSDPHSREGSPPPWPQRLYESVWVWAAVAVLFWLLSYLVWGFVDLISLPAG